MSEADDLPQEPADGDGDIVGGAFREWGQAICDSVERSIDPLDDRNLIRARIRLCDIATENLPMVTGAMVRIITDVGWSLPFRNPILVGDFLQEWGFSGRPENFREDVRKVFPDGVSPKVRAILGVAVKDFSDLFHSGLTVEMVAAVYAAGQWGELYREILDQARTLARSEDAQRLAVAVVSLCEDALRWLVVARQSAIGEPPPDRADWLVTVAEYWGRAVGVRTGEAGEDGSLYWQGDSPRELAEQVRIAQRW